MGSNVMYRNRKYAAHRLKRLRVKPERDGRTAEKRRQCTLIPADEPAPLNSKGKQTEDIGQLKVQKHAEHRRKAEQKHRSALPELPHQ